MNCWYISRVSARDGSAIACHALCRSHSAVVQNHYFELSFNRYLYRKQYEHKTTTERRSALKNINIARLLKRNRTSNSYSKRITLTRYECGLMSSIRRHFDLSDSRQRHCIIVFILHFLSNSRRSRRPIDVVGRRSAHCRRLFPVLCHHLWLRGFDVIRPDSRKSRKTMTTRQRKIEWRSYCDVSDYWIPGNETLYELAALFSVVIRDLSVYCDRSLLSGSIDCLPLMRRSPSLVASLKVALMVLRTFCAVSNVGFSLLQINETMNY